MSALAPPDGPGRFIVFEGPEGTGKSTQIDRFTRALRAVGHRVRAVREPGTTPVGERIRSLVLDPGVDTPVRSELLLMLAARAALVDRIVVPEVAKGTVVISDRFALSTFAYQGVGRNLGVETIEPLNRFATGGIGPHLTLVLDVPASERVARLELRGGARDRMEAEEARFHDRVRQAYARFARERPRTVAVDGSGSPDEVHARVVEAVGEAMGETFRIAGVTEIESQSR